MIAPHFDAQTPITDSALNVIAHLATEHLPKLASPTFFHQFTDANFMRLATLLAHKSYEEGGCPIGGVIIDDHRQILGKGHNTLGQENDSTSHGETAALRDTGHVAKLRGQGPVDFRPLTMFTTLTPCLVCCAQIVNRANFKRVVIGDITNAPSTANLLLEGVQRVDILEDPMAVQLYAKYAKERPDLHFIDWGGHRKFDEMR